MCFRPMTPHTHPRPRGERDSGGIQAEPSPPRGPEVELRQGGPSQYSVNQTTCRGALSDGRMQCEIMETWARSVTPRNQGSLKYVQSWMEEGGEKGPVICCTPPAFLLVPLSLPAVVWGGGEDGLVVPGFRGSRMRRGQCLPEGVVRMWPLPLLKTHGGLGAGASELDAFHVQAGVL